MTKGRFSGSPKPRCQMCLRRIYGVAKRGGWWCKYCEAWIVRPVALAPTPEEPTT